MQATPVFLPRESHGQRSLAGYSPWGHKEQDMTELSNCAQRHLPHPSLCVWTHSVASVLLKNSDKYG